LETIFNVIGVPVLSLDPFMCFRPVRADIFSALRRILPFFWLFQPGLGVYFAVHLAYFGPNRPISGLFGRFFIQIRPCWGLFGGF